MMGHHFSKLELKRILRFGLVGAVGTALDFGLLILLRTGLGWPTALANVFSYSAGIVNNYGLNRLWTFPEARGKQVAIQLMQFSLVSLTGLALNTVIVVILERFLAAVLTLPELDYVLAKIVATGLVFVWNFAANRWWTFNDTVTV
ncbi:MAG: GtrA family protein [Chloroflexi bacterium]|nr:GtrA family protein [Chloroflexota bacterium]